MPPSLRKAVAAAIGGGAIAIASVLITGPSGNDGLEGVRHNPYKDIVGVWTVCYGHTGKDIIPGKTYTEAECKALLNIQRSLLMLTRLSKVSVLMFLLGVSACKSPPPVQSQRPEPAAWAMEKAQDLQQMLNSIITVSEVESTR